MYFIPHSWSAEFSVLLSPKHSALTFRHSKTSLTWSLVLLVITQGQSVSLWVSPMRQCCFTSTYKSTSHITLSPILSNYNIHWRTWKLRLRISSSWSRSRWTGCRHAFLIMNYNACWCQKLYSNVKIKSDKVIINVSHNILILHIYIDLLLIVTVHLLYHGIFLFSVLHRTHALFGMYSYDWIHTLILLSSLNSSFIEL